MRITEERMDMLVDHYNDFNVKENFGMSISQYLERDAVDYQFLAEVERMYRLKSYYTYFNVADRYFLSFEDFIAKVDSGEWAGYQVEVQMYEKVNAQRIAYDTKKTDELEARYNSTVEHLMTHQRRDTPSTMFANDSIENNMRRIHAYIGNAGLPINMDINMDINPVVSHHHNLALANTDTLYSVRPIRFGDVNADAITKKWEHYQGPF